MIEGDPIKKAEYNTVTKHLCCNFFFPSQTKKLTLLTSVNHHLLLYNFQPTLFPQPFLNPSTTKYWCCYVKTIVIISLAKYDNYSLVYHFGIYSSHFRIRWFVYRKQNVFKSTSSSFYKEVYSSCYSSEKTNTNNWDKQLEKEYQVKQ